MLFDVITRVYISNRSTCKFAVHHTSVLYVNSIKDVTLGFLLCPTDPPYLKKFLARGLLIAL